MTESEAKKKRCCGPEGCGEYIHKESSRDRYCIGSECMAWKWTDQCTLADAVDWVQADPKNHKLEDFKPWNATKGFCGLAGKP